MQKLQYAPITSTLPSRVLHALKGNSAQPSHEWPKPSKPNFWYLTEPKSESEDLESSLHLEVTYLLQLQPQFCVNQGDVHANDLASDAKGQQDPLPPTATAASHGNWDQLCRTKHDISYVSYVSYVQLCLVDCIQRHFAYSPAHQSVAKMTSIVRVQETSSA